MSSPPRRASLATLRGADNGMTAGIRPPVLPRSIAIMVACYSYFGVRDRSVPPDCARAEPVPLGGGWLAQIACSPMHAQAKPPGISPFPRGETAFSATVWTCSANNTRLVGRLHHVRP